MKKILAITFVTLSATLAAQDDIDALRYSQTSFYGDARFMAMGGSFGALGANLSCMNFNPAGIAVYRNGEFVLTPGLRVQNGYAKHYDSSATDFATKLNITNIGFVSAWDQRNPYPATSKMYQNWNQRHAFGISYNRINDFNFNHEIAGVPDSSSMIDDFVDKANGFYPSQLNGTYEWLAYQTYLINPESASDSSHYWGMMLPGIPVRQSKSLKQTGRMGELAFSFAHAFEDKFYLGATLGIPMVRYNRQAIYTEEDHQDKVWPFTRLKYEEALQVQGSGYNLKVGAIYRVSGTLRVGAYAHTPSVINLSDNYEYKITALYDTAIAGGQNEFTASYDGYFKYKVYTPARGGASVAYVHKKLFAVNVDAEFIGYQSARLKDKDNYLKAVNLTIQNKYAGTLNLRTGIEFNLKPVAVRLGYAGYGSPFGSFTGKFARSSYSAGIGFKGRGNSYFDLCGIFTTWQEDHYLYDPDMVKASTLTNKVFGLMFTWGVKFN